MTTTEKLLRWKKQAEEGKLAKARLEGQLANLYDQLKKKNGCTTLKAARRDLDKRDKSITADEDAHDKMVADFESKNDWARE